MMMIAFTTFTSVLVPLIEVYVVQIHVNLSSRGLDGIEPTTWGLTVPRSDQLGHAYT